MNIVALTRLEEALLAAAAAVRELREEAESPQAGPPMRPWRPLAQWELDRLGPTSLVYFVQAEGGGPIKIGWSRSVVHRLGEMQIGCPLRLLVLTTMRGSGEVEADLHSRFRHLGLHGEWFRPEPELLTFIDLIASKEAAGA